MLGLVTFTYFIPHSDWCCLRSYKQVTKQTITVNKITAFYGFEHCWKHLDNLVFTQHNKIRNKDTVIFRHFNAEISQDISFKGF